MSKQDIEKRLGFAAQGVKAEMAIGSYKQGDRTVTVNGKKYEVLPYQMDFFIKELATLDTPEWRADVVKEYLRRGYIKATAARPGVKAKFAKPQFRTKKLHNGYIAVEVNQGSGWERYDTTHEESWNGIEEYERGYQKAYDRGLRYSGGAWRIPSTTASRPGAKAKFIRFMDLETWKNSKGTVFTAGIEDDAGRFQPYVTARDSSGGDQLQTRSAPTFKTEQGARKWLNTWMQNHKSTSSRPGTKAKMGLEMNMLDFRHKFFTAFGAAIRDAKSNPNTAEAQSDEAVLRESWASMFAQGYSDAISDLRGLSATMKSKTSVSQMRKAASDAMETYRQAKAAVRASRPGVKAKMGSSQVNDSATTADLIREAQRLRDVIKTSNREFDKTHLRQIKQELDKRGVLMPYGASEVLASRSGMKAKA